MSPVGDFTPFRQESYPPFLRDRPTLPELGYRPRRPLRPLLRRGPPPALNKIWATGLVAARCRPICPPGASNELIDLRLDGTARSPLLQLSAASVRFAPAVKRQLPSNGSHLTLPVSRR